MNIGNHWAAYFSSPQTIISYLLAYYRLSHKKTSNAIRWFKDWT